MLWQIVLILIIMCCLWLKVTRNVRPNKLLWPYRWHSVKVHGLVVRVFNQWSCGRQFNSQGHILSLSKTLLFALLWQKLVVPVFRRASLIIPCFMLVLPENYIKGIHVYAMFSHLQANFTSKLFHWYDQLEPLSS